MSQFSALAIARTPRTKSHAGVYAAFALPSFLTPLRALLLAFFFFFCLCRGTGMLWHKSSMIGFQWFIRCHDITLASLATKGTIVTK